MSFVQQGLTNLQQYIEKENYRGFDPYDGLKSPLFKIPFLKTFKPIRFYAQQAVKRSPVNLRGLLMVPKGYNPVTLGLCIQGYAYLLNVFPQHKEDIQKKIDFLIDELEKMQAKTFSGACWGYDFDWEARYAKIPGYEPTVVATGIVTNSLFECYKFTKNEKALELCMSACNFVLKDLKRTYDAEGNFCFSYSPFDTQVVFNASMKGARLLAQVYSVTLEASLKTEAQKAVAFVMKHQQPSGAWIYSTSEVGGWIDNYHTGYIIDCLHEYINCTGDNAYQGALENGLQFYWNNFFEDNRIPKFYDKEKFPIDCTAAGQSLLTSVRFNKLELAGNVATWMIENMQDKKGFFYFRKYKSSTEKISFMRWSNAWMFAGLSYLLHRQHTSGN
jgi:hypothetical protein